MPETDDQVRKPSRADDGSIGDLIDTLKAYARQEVIGPLSGAGRWVAYGAAGAACLGLGLVVVLLGLLRLVQTEWDRSSTGGLSWLAYLIVLAVTVLLLVLTLSRIRKSTLDDDSASSS